MYDACDSIGLQYGPGYRTLTHTWASGGVVASARLRTRLVRRGAQVHPADLDDALCVGGLASSDSEDGETRLPFAVEDAQLRGVIGKLWAVRCHGHSLPARSSTFDTHWESITRRFEQVELFTVPALYLLLGTLSTVKNAMRTPPDPFSRSICEPGVFILYMVHSG